MKMLRLALVVTLISPSLHGQKPAAARTAWKPENEVQKTAELVRPSLQVDFEEAALIHYTGSPAERKEFMADQEKHLGEDTKFSQAFSAALAQAVKAKRCDKLCASQIPPLLYDFAEMAKLVIMVDQEQIKPELLPQESARFAERFKRSGRYLRAIHLKPKAAPAG